MKSYFNDIFYPSDEKMINELISFENKKGKSKIIIIPHASLENINKVCNIAFLNIKKAKRYVFIAPMHNGKYPDNSNYLFTINDCKINNVNILPISSLECDNSILEEEYSLELTTLFLSKLDENITLLPIFAALEFSDEIKKLRGLIKSLDDGETSFIISANFSQECDSNIKAINMAKSLIKDINDKKPLIDDEKKGIISGCSIKILDAFRSYFSNFEIYGFQDGNSLLANVDDIKNNIIHLAGAFND